MHSDNGYILIRENGIEFETPWGDRHWVENFYFTRGAWVVLFYTDRFGMFRSHSFEVSALNYIRLQDYKDSQILAKFFDNNPALLDERHCYHVDFGMLTFCHDCKYNECRAH